jgi:hypothetical protein
LKLKNKKMVRFIERKLSWGWGISIIQLSMIISWIFATQANMAGIGLGGLVNIFLPPLMGILSIILYLLFYWINNKLSIVFMFLISLFNIYVGVLLFLDRI